MVLRTRAVGVVHELRRLVTPASVGATDTSLGQEDLQASASWPPGTCELTREVVAIAPPAARLGRCAPVVRAGRPGTAWTGSGELLEHLV